MFSEEQIQHINSIISLNHVLFIGKNVGTEVLSDYDKFVLEKHGFKISDIEQKYNPFEQAFYFGRLSSILQDEKVKKITYNNFLKYLRSQQYIPLTEKEKGTLRFLKNHTYNYIKGLENSAIKDINGIIITEQQKKRSEYEKVIKDAVKEAIVKRQTVKDVMSAIGNKTGDWQRNLGRIADTEMQRAFEYGRMENFKRFGGEKMLVYKEVFPLACKYCQKLYTVNGVGSKPILFTIEELERNGNNIGRKPEEWIPTISPIHPFCRCILQQYIQGSEWDVKQGRWVMKKPKQKVDRQGAKWKITIGDQIFEV